MSVREVTERHPRPVSIDRVLLLRGIDECLDCAATCNACADACLGEPDVAELVRCVRLNLDCADVCGTVGRMLSRQTEMDLGAVRAALEAGVVTCRVCGDSASATRPITTTAACAPSSAVAASRCAATCSHRSGKRRHSRSGSSDELRAQHPLLLLELSDHADQDVL